MVYVREWKWKKVGKLNIMKNLIASEQNKVHALYMMITIYNMYMISHILT